jgi:hypothetical protein
MSEATLGRAPAAKTPWHLWVIGVLSLFWNAAGAYTIVSAQAGRLPGIEQSEADYYAAQAAWFIAVTDLALFAAILAATAMVVRSRWAVHLYWLSVAAIVVTAGYDIAKGTAYILTDDGAMVATGVIWILALGQLAYASVMRSRGVLH